MSTSPRRPKGWEDGIAWIAEDCGGLDGDPFADEGMFALARFDAHVESEALASGLRDGPSGVPAADAIAWGRRYAARVIVRWWGPDGVTHASAGEREVEWDDEAALPRWDAALRLAPRRIPGWEHLDRVATDPAIPWEVLVHGDVWRPPKGFAAAVRAALEGAADAELVVLAYRDTSPRGRTAYVAMGEGLRVHLRLTASTHEQACDRGVRLVTSATADALGPAGVAPDQLHIASSDAFPTGTEAAETNARIDRSGRLF